MQQIFIYPQHLWEKTARCAGMAIMDFYITSCTSLNHCFTNGRKNGKCCGKREENFSVHKRT